MLELDATVRRRDVSAALDLPEGDTLAVLGPNGAGKSTLLGLIAGLVRPDDGVVRLAGRTVAEAHRGRLTRWVPPHRRGAALLAQDALLFPHLTVEENVAFGPRARGLGGRQAREAARGWLAELDARDLATRRPGELSGGQSQRVALARALAAEPRLLLLDEPMAALDVSAAPELRRTLRAVLADRTAVIVTHEVLDAYLLADRVVVLDGGRIVDAGATHAVLDRPASAFVASLVGVNLLTGTIRGGALHLADGTVVRGRPAEEHVALAEGSSAGVALHPAAVTISRTEPPADRNRLRASAIDLEPAGGLVRIRTTALFVDLTAAEAAALDPAPGTALWASFRPEDTLIHPLSRRSIEGEPPGGHGPAGRSMPS